jgi:hypothetical protein
MTPLRLAQPTLINTQFRCFSNAEDKPKRKRRTKKEMEEAKMLKEQKSEQKLDRQAEEKE